MSINIIVAGVGGQGSILASHIIADAAIKADVKSSGNSNVRVGETFGAAMASSLFPFTEEFMLEAVTECVPKKTLEVNLKAFALGKEAYSASVQS